MKANRISKRPFPSWMWCLYCMLSGPPSLYIFKRFCSFFLWEIDEPTILHSTCFETIDDASFWMSHLLLCLRRTHTHHIIIICAWFGMTFRLIDLIFFSLKPFFFLCFMHDKTKLHFSFEKLRVFVENWEKWLFLQILKFKFEFMSSSSKSLGFIRYVTSRHLHAWLANCELQSLMWGRLVNSGACQITYEAGHWCAWDVWNPLVNRDNALNLIIKCKRRFSKRKACNSRQ